MTATEHIDNYDEKNVEEVKSDISEHGLDQSPGTLGDVHEYELENKQRVTLLRWIESRVDDLYQSAQTDGTGVLAEGSEDDVVAPVRVAAPQKGFYVGREFEEAYATEVVYHNERVKRAINRGDLILVDEDPQRP